MMTIEGALKAVEEKEPELTVLRGTECINWFKFFMVNKKGEGIGNGYTYAVNKKTGECGWKSMFADEKFMNDIPIKDFSIDEIKTLLTRI